MDARNAGLIQDFRVGSFALPLDAEACTEAAQVKSVVLFGVSAIDSPGLTGIEESGQHYHTVDSLVMRLSPLRSQTVLQ